MSASAVQEFLEKVQTDESLAQELITALEAENDREAVAELATSKGYEVTSEELWAEIQKRQEEIQKRQEAGELSDEELEAVAGGGTPIVLKSVKATIEIATMVTPRLPRPKW